MEVKCLNILRLHSANDIINGDCQSAEVKRQCFAVEDKKLVLKRTFIFLPDSITVTRNESKIL